jgi:hypothetical protein
VSHVGQKRGPGITLFKSWRAELAGNLVASATATKRLVELILQDGKKFVLGWKPCSPVFSREKRGRPNGSYSKLGTGFPIGTNKPEKNHEEMAETSEMAQKEGRNSRCYLGERKVVCNGWTS